MSDYHRLLRGQGQPAARILRQVSRPRGMTKLDLLVGCVVAVILLTLVVMAVSKQQFAARRNLCEKRQTALAEAFRLYAGIQREYPGWRQPGGESRTDSWPVAILPWLGRPLEPDERTGETPIDASVRGPRGTLYDELQKSAAAKYLPEFLCSTDSRLGESMRPRPAWLSFVANTGMPDVEELAEGIFPDKLANGVLLDYTRDKKQRSSPEYVGEHDGEQFTLLLSENIDARLWSDTAEATLGFVWTSPPGLAINELMGKGDGSLRFARPAAGHRGGVNVVFCGENNSFLSEKIAPQVLRELMTSDREGAR